MQKIVKLCTRRADIIDADAAVLERAGVGAAQAEVVVWWVRVCSCRACGVLASNSAIMDAHFNSVSHRKIQDATVQGTRPKNLPERSYQRLRANGGVGAMA